MGIRAGLLRDIVTIVSPVVTRNDYGEEVTTWEEVATTRTRVDFRSGTRAVEANEVVNPYTVTFVIRRFIQLNGYMRIRWKGREYAIESINDEGHNQQQVIIASVINE